MTNHLGPGFLLGGGKVGVDVFYVADGKVLKYYDRITAMMEAETIYAYGFNQLAWTSQNVSIYANQDETQLGYNLDGGAVFCDFGKDLPWAFV